MPLNRTITIDGSIAISLACALGVVFLTDRPRKDAQDLGVRIERKESLAPSEPVQTLRLAVTPPQYDDMGKLLAELGSGFSYSSFPVESLEDSAKLKQYDVLFLTCAGVPDSWVSGGLLGDGERPGTHNVKVNEQILERVKQAVRAFVGGGGTLYASDWQHLVVRYSFPELFDGKDFERGADQSVTAEVVNAGLRDLIGAHVELKFDLPGWFPANFASDKGTRYLQGEYRTIKGSRATAPLLVKAPFEQGTIIFTSFHNEKVNSEVETKLLRFLVFAAVTAKEASAAQRTMISGGFSPQKQTLLSASPEAPSVTQVYANARRGRLQFVLSFADGGALLRLSVRDPTGRTHEQEGTSTFTIDVADGAAGDWSYTVTALKVPYPNFPFTLTVGDK